MVETIASFFRDGGIFMYIILALLVVGVAIIIERGYVLIYWYNINARALWKKVGKLILDGNIEDARVLCKDSRVPLLKILDTGLAVSDESETIIERAIDEITLEIIPSIEKRIPYLATLANIATLMGLLGTINGLVQSFTAVGSADPSQKASLLAKGIALALNTTSFGLIAAIPMLGMYTVLTAKANNLISEIDEFSVKFVNTLYRRKNGVQIK